MSGQQYSPREYIEHQLSMTEEEKEQRSVFFSEMFAKHNAEREQRELQP